MIWPFKRDLLERDAALLVGAANTHAVSMFVTFVDEFPFIPYDERDQRYWDFVVTIAGVFLALIRLRTLNLNENAASNSKRKSPNVLCSCIPGSQEQHLKSVNHFSTKPITIL